jgi:5,10-methylenetetrahydrofolate reductase
MSLEDKLLHPSLPVTFFEMVPPAEDKPGSVDAAVAEAEKVRHLVDAINLPEIHDEARGTPRAQKFVPRLEPRKLGARILGELSIDVVVNHCVVYEPDPLRWFRQTAEEFGIRNVVLVGGESSQISYPGPSVLEAARQVRAARLATCMGGIIIPSRLHEAERVRQKKSAGLDFFTTQILFDPNDIVWLIQRLNGLEARVFLSFAPVSHPRDLEFLRWLGADIPPDLDRFLLLGESRGAKKAQKDEPASAKGKCLERSIDLAQRILMDVFDNLPPDPPPLGLNIEHINRRNFPAAVEMLDRLGNLYASLVAARVP